MEGWSPPHPPHLRDAMPKKEDEACCEGGTLAYKCSWCDKPFRYPSQLKEHERVHTREKPYPCGFCDKAFSHSSALTQHERIHTGDKPFTCRICNKSFSQSSNLKRHERVHGDSLTNLPSSQSKSNKLQRLSPNDRKTKRKSSGKKSASKHVTKINSEIMTSPSRPVDMFLAQRFSPRPPFLQQAPAPWSQPRLSPRYNKGVKRNLSANLASVSGNGRYKPSYTPIKSPVCRISAPLSPTPSKVDENRSRNYYPGLDIMGSTSPWRMHAKKQSGTSMNENLDPTGKSNHWAKTHNAIGKSIDDYMLYGQPAASPLIHDDASQFQLSKFVWSPILSPRNSPARSPSHSYFANTTSVGTDFDASKLDSPAGLSKTLRIPGHFNF